jgi:UDP:flavonoid glycosyltransferase YjiC (YdhE family)
MKILVAPLNWGLGHASRCISLIRQYIASGDEVVLAGDGDSIMLLRRTFPELRCIDLPSLELRYTHNTGQRGFYLRAIPALIRFTIADHYYLRQLLNREHFDKVISDNRFGLFSRDVDCTYITHQLYPILPKRLRIFQPIARALHACIYRRYKHVWVPDYADCRHNLAGALAHGGNYDHKVEYIGPLSRFEPCAEGVIENNKIFGESFSTVAVLSGLEPQRTLFEQALIERFRTAEHRILIVRGKVGLPATITHLGTVTMVSHLPDEQLLPLLMQADRIIARSGYSTIMDLAVLNLLDKAEFYPTPGQSEQEYLVFWHKSE